MVGERRSPPILVDRPWVDPWRAFLAAAALRGRVLLDSGGDIGLSSRWSVLAVNPLETLEWRVPQDRSSPEERHALLAAGEDPFALLDALHTRWAERLPSGAPVRGPRFARIGLQREWAEILHRARRPRRGESAAAVAPAASPGGPLTGAGFSDAHGFTGGVIAAIGYDAARALERLPCCASDDPSLPDLWAAAYDGAILFDRLRRRVLLTSWLPDEGARQEEREELLRESGRPSYRGTVDLEGRVPGTAEIGRPSPGAAAEPPDDDGKEQFLEGVRRIKKEIERGEIYQANLTRRIVRPGSLLDGPGIYERLRRLSPTPFAAYVDAGAFHLLSASPERLLRIGRSGEVNPESPSGSSESLLAETRPIKGTRPRGRDPAEDAALKAELLASSKDRAELLMIVDLERNDLGRVCLTGTIEVSELSAVEGYSTIWHLVATVRGRLDPEVSPITALRALFPGGSITGAPKIRAMEILESLETHRRKFAMGSLVAWDFSGEIDSSILIRTMVLSGGRAVLCVGGGIVTDSSPEAEYEETVVKAAPLLAALEESALEESPLEDP